MCIRDSYGGGPHRGVHCQGRAGGAAGISGALGAVRPGGPGPEHPLHRGPERAEGDSGDPPQRGGAAGPGRLRQADEGGDCLAVAVDGADGSEINASPAEKFFCITRWEKQKGPLQRNKLHRIC